MPAASSGKRAFGVHFATCAKNGGWFLPLFSNHHCVLTGLLDDVYLADSCRAQCHQGRVEWQIHWHQNTLTIMLTIEKVSAGFWSTFRLLRRGNGDTISS